MSNPAPPTTTDEINAAIAVMRNLLSVSTATTASTAPQVIVVYKNNKRAYGRAYLKSLGYRWALCKLREQYGLRNGKAPEPTWETKALATFARTHGHNDRDAVILDEASWDELIDNVAKIELDPHRRVKWATVVAIIACFIFFVRFLMWAEMM